MHFITIVLPHVKHLQLKMEGLITYLIWWPFANPSWLPRFCDSSC